MSVPRSNGLIPLSFAARNRPADKWGSVQKDQIGKGFEVAETVLLANEKKRVAKDEKADPLWKNKFIEGSSEFIFFVVTPKPAKKPDPVRKKPFNFQNKLDKKTKRVFENRLSKNIDETANFMVKELLPITMSLHSALQRTEELVTQLTDGKELLPTSLLQRKMELAVHLRVTRFMSERFGLTEKEQRLMLPELTKPWSES